MHVDYLGEFELMKKKCGIYLLFIITVIAILPVVEN